MRDGLSNTIAAGEKKAFMPYMRDGSGMTAVPALTATDLSGLGGSQKDDSGNTEWCDGRTHQDGLTTTFPPNTVTKNSGHPDGDYTSPRRQGVIKPFSTLLQLSHHEATTMVVFAMVL